MTRPRSVPARLFSLRAVRRRAPAAALLLALSVLAGALPAPAHAGSQAEARILLAQSDVAAVPENARARRYGTGWECNPGFRAADGACAAIKVPANAYPTNMSFGQGWECRRGYIETRGECAAVRVPANAFLNASGDGWECERGFNNPRHDSGCEKVVVPTNGYLNGSGDGWECERGYRRDGVRCAAIAVPENAYFVDAFSGSGWKCLRGFKAIGESCKPLALPQGAHLDYSGNDWDCDPPLRKREDACAER